MAKQRENSNVIDLIEPAPEGLNISREDWARTPNGIRDETLRMVRELSEGIAIDKDRMAGRNVRVPGKPDPGKRVKGGFWELHCCERDGTPESLARASELREILAPEIALHALNEELAPFHEMAKANNTTLAVVMRRYLAMEDLLRRDPDAGIISILTNLGIDPIDYATVVAAGAELAHGNLLRLAAHAIRREPKRNWEGLQFGFLAQDVQRVRPECVVMQPNGFLAVDYVHLFKTPEVCDLPLYTFQYTEGTKDLHPPQFEPSDEVA